MNFLQLAQAVKRESGLSGGAPASLATAKGDDARIFQWVNWAWRDIALMHESWFFRRAEALGETSTMTMAASASLPGFALTDWATWKPQADDYRPSAWRLTDGQAAEHPLQFLPYDTFRSRFIVGVHTPGPVRFWSVAPSGDLLLGPTPDAAHRVGEQINGIKAQHAAESAKAQADTRARELAINQRLQDAQNEATKRETKLRGDAAAARRTADGLRGTLYEFRASLPNAAPGALIARADTAAELLGTCADEYRSVAEAADRHAGDALMLQEAWPK